VVAIVHIGRKPATGMKHVVVPAFVLVLAAFFLYSQRKEGFYLLPFAPFFAILVAYVADALRAGVAWLASRTSAKGARAGVVAAALAAALVAMPAVADAQKSYHSYALGETNEKYFG